MTLEYLVAAMAVILVFSFATAIVYCCAVMINSWFNDID
jgi:hypothetical protein